MICSRLYTTSFTNSLAWLQKDLHKWASALGAVDKDDKVLSTTSITPAKDHPQSRDAAMMSKRDCRTVFIQIAQQTRLRSIFTKNKMARLSDDLIPKVLKQPTFAMTEWEDRPSWWNEANMDDVIDGNCIFRDDLDLLAGILDYGYGGFEALLEHEYSFCAQLKTEGNSASFTRAIVQTRINHLTRELHANDETEE